DAGLRGARRAADTGVRCVVGGPAGLRCAGSAAGVWPAAGSTAWWPSAARLRGTWAAAWVWCARSAARTAAWLRRAAAAGLRPDRSAARLWPAWPAAGLRPARPAARLRGARRLRSAARLRWPGWPGRVLTWWPRLRGRPWWPDPVVGLLVRVVGRRTAVGPGGLRHRAARGGWRIKPGPVRRPDHDRAYGGYPQQ